MIRRGALAPRRSSSSSNFKTERCMLDSHGRFLLVNGTTGPAGRSGWRTAAPGRSREVRSADVALAWSPSVSVRHAELTPPRMSFEPRCSRTVSVIQIMGGRGPPGRARTCPVPGARLRAGRVVMRAKRRGPRPPPRFPVPGQTSVADAPTRGEAFTPTFQKKSTAMKVQ